MKNQYFGDINDYRKYGLLRGLSNNGEISTFVCWMLTENDSRSDGKFISYLDKREKFRKYDPELFDVLFHCIRSGKRNVDFCGENSLISKSGYFNSIIPDNTNQREQYFNELYNKAKQYDLVFLDPDNGMEIKSRKKGNKFSSKYVYYDEVRNLYFQGKSLLIYQHFIREERNKFIQRISENLKIASGCQIIIPIRTSNVVYFLIPKDGMERYLKERVNLVSTTWEEEIIAVKGI